MPRTVQIARRILLRIRAPVAVSKRDPVDFAREWREPSLIRMRLAGQRQRHHGASVERVFESDDARSLRISARNLDRVLDSFRATIDEDRLLRELPRSNFVHPLSKADIALIRRHLHAGVQEAIELVFHRIDYFLTTMAHIEAADASGKVDIAIAVDIFEPGPFGLGHINRRAMRKPARHGLRAALRQGLRLRARNYSAELNSRHLVSRR